MRIQSKIYFQIKFQLVNGFRVAERLFLVLKLYETIGNHALNRKKIIYFGKVNRLPLRNLKINLSVSYI